MRKQERGKDTDQALGRTGGSGVVRRGRRRGGRGKRLQVRGGLKVRRGGTVGGAGVTPLWLPEPISPGQKLSSSRDQRESVEVLSKDWHAHTHKFARGCARNVQRGGSRVHLGETSQQVAPQSGMEARDNESRY